MKKYFLSAVLMVSFFLPVTAQAQAPTPDAAVNGLGIKISDPSRGVEFTAPNDKWGANASTYSISLNHNTNFDAQVTLKKSWFSVSSAQEAYGKRKDSLKSYMPGAVFIKENEPVTIGGNIPAVSMTYKNPSDLKIFREIMFVHKGNTYELVFQAKEENFAGVKGDFGYILQNMKLY